MTLWCLVREKKDFSTKTPKKAPKIRATLLGVNIHEPLGDTGIQLRGLPIGEEGSEPCFSDHRYMSYWSKSAIPESHFSTRFSNSRENDSGRSWVEDTRERGDSSITRSPGCGRRNGYEDGFECLSGAARLGRSWKAATLRKGVEREWVYADID